MTGRNRPGDPGLSHSMAVSDESVSERNERDMTKYIVHPGTLTVIAADECLILDIDTDLSDEERAALDGDDYFDDGLICEYAEQRGKNIINGNSVPCDNCGSEVLPDNGGLCDSCFEKLPTGEWRTAGTW